MGAEEKQSDGSITIAASHQLLVQTDTTYYSIRRTDWKRLCRDINLCQASGIGFYSNAGWAGVGASMGFIATLIGLYAASPAVPSWTKIVCWAAIICTSLIGAVLLLVARDKSSDKSQLLARALGDMREMEALFYEGGSKGGALNA